MLAKKSAWEQKRNEHVEISSGGQFSEFLKLYLRKLFYVYKEQKISWEQNAYLIDKFL